MDYYEWVRTSPCRGPGQRCDCPPLEIRVLEAWHRQWEENHPDKIAWRSFERPEKYHLNPGQHIPGY
jgi:hypothetical protein